MRAVAVSVCAVACFPAVASAGVPPLAPSQPVSSTPAPAPEATPRAPIHGYFSLEGGYTRQQLDGVPVNAGGAVVGGGFVGRRVAFGGYFGGTYGATVDGLRTAGGYTGFLVEAVFGPLRLGLGGRAVFMSVSRATESISFWTPTAGLLAHVAVDVVSLGTTRLYLACTASADDLNGPLLGAFFTLGVRIWPHADEIVREP